MIQVSLSRAVCTTIALSLPAALAAETVSISKTYENTFGEPPLYSDFMVGGDGAEPRSLFGGTINISTDTRGDMIAFCIELPQNLALPATYNDVAAPFGAANSDRLSRLFTGHYEQIDTEIEAAAFQIAVWEIINDDQVDLNSGSFQLLSNPAVKMVATAYLASLSEYGADYDLTYFQSKDSQNLISGVPLMTTFSGS